MAFFADGRRENLNILEALKRSKELLDKVNANIIGAVLNHLDKKSQGNYYYYQYYYSEDEGGKRKRVKKRKSRRNTSPDNSMSV